MQPIPTIYKGYAMRSRLEARWAHFFDSLGISWEYEVEGFDLGEYGWYLPDFYLPQWKCWIEIKPATNSQDDLKLWRRKCGAVARGNKEDALLISGTPWPGEYQIIHIDEYGDWNGPGQFAIGRRCSHVYILVDDSQSFYYCSLECDCGNYDRAPLTENGRLTIAYNHARRLSN